jgi:hypothetical protein
VFDQVRDPGALLLPPVQGKEPPVVACGHLRTQLECGLDHLPLAHARPQQGKLDPGVEQVVLGLGDPPQAVPEHPQGPDGGVLVDAGGDGRLDGRQEAEVVLADQVIGSRRGEPGGLVSTLQQSDRHVQSGGQVAVGLGGAPRPPEQRMVEERQGELPGSHGGADPLQRKPRLGTRAGQADTPDIARSEGPRTRTRHQDAELDQPLDILGQDASPTGQLGDRELFHAHHVQNRSRNDGSLPTGRLLEDSSRCRDLLTGLGDLVVPVDVDG